MTWLALLLLLPLAGVVAAMWIWGYLFPSQRLLPGWCYSKGKKQ